MVEDDSDEDVYSDDSDDEENGNNENRCETTIAACISSRLRLRPLCHRSRPSSSGVLDSYARGQRATGIYEPFAPARQILKIVAGSR